MIICRRDRLPTPVFWPGEFHELYSPWHPKESSTYEQLFTLIPGTEQALSEWWLDEPIIMNEKVLVYLNVSLFKVYFYFTVLNFQA